MRSCSSSTFQWHTFLWRVGLDVGFEDEVKIREDGEYEEDCVVDNPHSLLGIPRAEADHIDHGGDEEDDEDHEGQHQGGVGHCHQIRWSAKLARVRSFNTEAAPEDIDDISEGGR